MRALLARVPPPLLFVLPLAIGMRLDALHPRPWVPYTLAPAGRVAGWVLVGLGAALDVCCVAMFLRRRTTIVPHRRAASLVTTGPFCLSRNPMYVALSCLYLGVSALTNALWPLLFLPVPLVFLQTVTIPVEERILADAFGEPYRAYASRVRRWL